MKISKRNLNIVIKEFLSEIRDGRQFDTASTAYDIAMGNKKRKKDTNKEISEVISNNQKSISENISDLKKVSRSLDWGDDASDKKSAWAYLYPFFADLSNIELRNCGKTKNTDVYFLTIAGDGSSLKKRMELIENDSNLNSKIKLKPLGSDGKSGQNTTIGKIKGTKVQAIFLRFDSVEEYDSKFFDIFLEDN